MTDLFNTPFIIAILIALTIHEYAHALAAYLLGDMTARDEGRLTLNPIAHLDPIGTILFFLVRFGWGKPVPIDPRAFRHPKRDSAIVALAGPFSNIVIVALCIFLMTMIMPDALNMGPQTQVTISPDLLSRTKIFVVQILYNSIFINAALMAFNLLPIAPLDGSKIVQAFIPPSFEDRYDRWMERGPMILLGIIIVERTLNVHILLPWISVLMDAVINPLKLLFL